jgi:hypothetical protein
MPYRCKEQRWSKRRAYGVLGRVGEAVKLAEEEWSCEKSAMQWDYREGEGE